MLSRAVQTQTLHCSVSLNHCLSPGVFIPRPSQSVCPCGDLETELRCAICKQARKSRDCPITWDNLPQQAGLLQREVWLPLNSSVASLPCKAWGRLFLTCEGTARRVCTAGRRPAPCGGQVQQELPMGCSPRSRPPPVPMSHVPVSLCFIFHPPSSLRLAFNLCLTCCAGNCRAFSAW